MWNNKYFFELVGEGRKGEKKERKEGKGMDLPLSWNAASIIHQSGMSGAKDQEKKKLKWRKFCEIYFLFFFLLFFTSSAKTPCHARCKMQLQCPIAEPTSAFAPHKNYHYTTRFIFLFSYFLIVHFLSLFFLFHLCRLTVYVPHIRYAKQRQREKKKKKYRQ